VQSEPEPPAPAAHWIDNEDTRKRFWTWTSGLGLSNAEVHEALGVEHVAQYPGSPALAKAAINAYIAAHAAPVEQEAV
jgi:hypothetical protein